MTNITLFPSVSKGTIDKAVYGHFSEHIGGVFYGGLWVGEDSPIRNYRGWRADAVDALKKVSPAVLRWPGGCFSETYNWRDGIGPRDKRPRRVNWWYYQDHRVETNQVGTNEFVHLCRLIGAEPYFAANITSTTPMDIRDWIEYCNFPAGTTTLADMRAENGDVEPFNVQYWGIGNENWGGGGNMTPEMYAREMLRYHTVCWPVGLSRDGKTGVKAIGCGANSDDMDWTDRMMREYNNRVPLYALSFHYYCGSAGDCVNFSEEEWYRLLSQASYMQKIMDHHRGVMDRYDPQRKITLACDEWGCWHPDGSGPSKGYNLFEQQSTMRDALVASLTLDIFNNSCDIIKMANVAQICNNLHCLILAGTGENEMIVTPTYHVFDMYQKHQDAEHISSVVECGKKPVEGRGDLPLVSVSASKKEGKTLITVSNLNYSAEERVKICSDGDLLKGSAKVTQLYAVPQAHNTFDKPDAVKPNTFTYDIDGGIDIYLPPASVTSFEIG